MEILTVKHLGKRYKRYSNKWKRVVEWVGGNKVNMHEDVWVLRDLNFAINKGEAVGIIGQNGAGKSTLLKILTGTTGQSLGEYRVNGKISALLELGMGFHPEFTGRQNAYMSGQLMGISNAEIEALMPLIEDFAEIGDYIDQPLRVYSSGMVIRLAFSVATAVRPEILIVDEALSVGDAYFQSKSFERIRDFRNKGTTLLFVSHDPGAIKSICNRAILLDRGLQVKSGDPEDVLNYYNAIIVKDTAEMHMRHLNEAYGNKSLRTGDAGVRIKKVEILTDGKEVRVVQVGDKVEVKIEIEIYKEINQPNIGLLFRDRLGNDIWGTNTELQNVRIEKCAPGDVITASFMINLNFGYGNYSITAACTDGPTHLSGSYEWWDHAGYIQIIPGKENMFIGTTYLEVKINAVRNEKNNLYKVK